MDGQVYNTRWDSDENEWLAENPVHRIQSESNSSAYRVI